MGAGASLGVHRADGSGALGPRLTPPTPRTLDCQGSPLHTDDLRECAIKSAMSVVVLSAPPDVAPNFEDTSLRSAVMQDSNAVLATLAVRTALGGAAGTGEGSGTESGGPFVVTLLNEGSNVRFFDVQIESTPKEAVANWKDVLKKAGRKRMVATNSSPDLTKLASAGSTPSQSPGRRCRAFQSTENARLVSNGGGREARHPPRRARTSANGLRAPADFTDKDATSLISGSIDTSLDFAAGRVFSPPLLNKLFSEAYYHPYSMALIRQLLEGDVVRRRHLFRRPVGRRWSGDVWWALFQHLCELDCTPIALYRSHQTASGRTRPYVYTNPEPDTVLADDDFVFVIGPIRDDCATK